MKRLKTLPLLRGLLLVGLLCPIGIPASPEPVGDWLIDPRPFAARVTPSADGREVELANGLVRRVIRLQPNAATVALDNLMTGDSLVRSVRPEARVELDGKAYEIGGLRGQPIHNYLSAAWLDTLEADAGAFRTTGFKVGRTEARFPWKKRPEWMSQDRPWPPPGVSLTLEFQAPPDSHRGVAVEVHYELYDGIPLLSK